MNDRVKIALIAAATAVTIAGMVIYFSPYHSCVREMKAEGGYYAEDLAKC